MRGEEDNHSCSVDERREVMEYAMGPIHFDFLSNYNVMSDSGLVCCAATLHSEDPSLHVHISYGLQQCPLPTSDACMFSECCLLSIHYYMGVNSRCCTWFLFL